MRTCCNEFAERVATASDWGPAVAMPLKKPGLGPLTMPLERQGSFNMSDTGSFSQENFTISKNGITQSPLLQGEVTSLRLEQLDIGAQLGRGASAKVYLATHTPTNKQLALKVLDNDLEASLEHRRLLLNEVKLVYNARSDHLLTFYDAFLHEGHIYLALEYMDMGSVERLFDAPKQAGHAPLERATPPLARATLPRSCTATLHTLPRQAGARLPEQVLANVLVQVLEGLTLE
jgi:serine/threonine protein kinase